MPSAVYRDYAGSGESDRVYGAALHLVLLYGRKSTAHLVGGIVSSLAAAAFTLLLPSRLGRLYAEIGALDLHFVIEVAFVAAGWIISMFLARYLLGEATDRGLSALREDLFDRLLGARVAVHDTMRQADNTALITSDAVVLHHAIAQVVPWFFLHVPVVLAGITFLVAANPTLSLSLAAAGLPLALILLFLGREIRTTSMRAHRLIGKMAVISNDVFSKVRFVKASGAEGYFRAHFRRFSSELMADKRRRRLLYAYFDLAVPLSLIGLTVIGVWVIHMQLSEGSAGGRDVVTYAAYLAAVSGSAVTALRIYPKMSELHGPASRILEALRRPQETGPESDSIPDRSVRGEIYFKSVGFTYPGATFSIRDANFSIDPGERVAIVGPNGAGKSTLIHLLLRFYEPDSGSISLDGMSSRGCTLAEWRKRVALISRDPAIFAVSILENLTLGDPCRDPDAVESAATVTGLHEFVRRLPDGYDAVLGDDGIGLSSGQKQRLALTRLLLQDPSVIVLDEGLTSVDERGSRDFVRSLLSLFPTTTMIFISHDPRGVPEVHRSLHVDGGRVVVPAGMESYF